MKYAIEIYFTKDKMPPVGHIVIIEGGIAEYNGEDWISHTGGACGNKICWDVKWWTELIVNKDIDNAEEVVTISDVLQAINPIKEQYKENEKQIKLLKKKQICLEKKADILAYVEKHRDELL